MWLYIPGVILFAGKVAFLKKYLLAKGLMDIWTAETGSIKITVLFECKRNLKKCPAALKERDHIAYASSVLKYVSPTWDPYIKKDISALRRVALYVTGDYYRKTSNISRTLLGNKIVDNSDVVGASPVGAAPTTSSFSTKHLAPMDWARTIARRYKKHLSFGIWCDLY